MIDLALILVQGLSRDVPDACTWRGYREHSDLYRIAYCPGPNPPPPGPSFFVSPSGNDASIGSLVAPFLTLGKCQQAMENSATVKTCTARAGNYGNVSIFLNGPTDNGQTWQFYQPDGVCTAVIDHGGSATSSFIIGAANVTINGFKVQNVGEADGIQARGPNHNGTGFNTINNIIINNCVLNYNNINSQPIGVWGAQNTMMKNNVIINTNSKGIGISATQNGDVYSGSDIENNVIVNSSTSNPDNGAIYMQDLNGAGGVSTGNTIKNNFIRDYGSVVNFNKGIYFDDGASNVTATDNLISGLGQYCFQFHGGDNLVANGNLCDLGANGNQFALFYQFSPGFTVNNMAGNQFSGNIFINAGSVTPTTYNTNLGGQALPVVAASVYHSYGSAGVNSSSNGITDSNPQLVDPQLSGWTFTIAAGSPVFSAPTNFPPVPGGWGPPGLAINSNGTVTLNGVQLAPAGTPPSSPH